MVACKPIPRIGINRTRLGQAVDLLKCADRVLRRFIVNAGDNDVGENIVNDVDSREHDLNQTDEVAFLVPSDGIAACGEREDRQALLCQREGQTVGVCDRGPCCEIDGSRRRQSEVALKSEYRALGLRTEDSIGIDEWDRVIRLCDQTEHGL